MKTTKKVLAVILALVVLHCVGIGIRILIDKERVKEGITEYLTSTYGLEDVEVVFYNPDYFNRHYSLEIKTSNFDSLPYEEMIELDSNICLEPYDVHVLFYYADYSRYSVFDDCVFCGKWLVYERKENYGIVADMPYVGMDEKYISNTGLGAPDRSDHDSSGMRSLVGSALYYWYGTNGKVKYCVFCSDGVVKDVTEYWK